MKNLMHTRLLIVPILALASACVESRDLPALTAQTTVTYGDKLFLVDTTIGARPSGERCTQLGITSSSAAALMTAGIDPDTPHNCYVRLQPTAPAPERRLRVDVVEVSNEQFQLCVDSGACTGPDPSKSSASQICQVADRFDGCPVVEVPQVEAANYCRWVGRRLPTSLEHLVIRQSNLANSQQADLIPDYVSGDGTQPPATCDDAVLGTAGCMATKPRPVLDEGGEPVGAGARDTIVGEDGQNIFDLTGNLSEWSADLFPARRGNENDLPWFCVATLTRTSTQPFSMSNPPTCPAGAVCVYGQYRFADDEPVQEYPVCITNATAQFSGVNGAVHGGSHKDDSPAPEAIGIYSRKVETEPQTLSDTSRARGYGFRCVGNRESGVRDDMGVLQLPAFDDRFELVEP